MRSRKAKGLMLWSICLVALAACATNTRQPMAAPTPVDLGRFMGDWYVIASIPTALETKAYNAVESYARNPDGTIATTFTFNKGGFSGPLQRHTPRGFVRPGSGNAVWGMRFIWPIKAEYIVAHVDDAYTETIIGRSKRDYVWVMARTPLIAADRYQSLVQRVQALGYDIAKLNRVPQQPR